MSTPELKKKLIAKISVLEDEGLLQEVYRLLKMGEGDFEPYKLSNEQINVVNDSQEEIKKGKFLTDKEADKDIDEWLGK